MIPRPGNGVDKSRQRTAYCRKFAAQTFSGGANMKSAWWVSGLIAAISWSTIATAAEPRLPIHVVYLGNAGKPRATAFVDFLRTRFEQVTEKNRDDVDLESLRGGDVVLLDWSQRDAESETAVSPLGPRSQWSKPTVLLGSAGHLLATPWETVGGAG
jgi:hypothetical protein